MLDLVQKDLDSLSTCCESMGASLAGSRSAAADLLHDTEKLQRALQAGNLICVFAPTSVRCSAHCCAAAAARTAAAAAAAVGAAEASSAKTMQQGYPVWHARLCGNCSLHRP